MSVNWCLTERHSEGYTCILLVEFSFQKPFVEGFVISQKLVFAVQWQCMSLIPETKAGESLSSRPASIRVGDATQRKLVLEINVYF